MTGGGGGGRGGRYVTGKFHWVTSLDTAYPAVIPPKHVRKQVCLQA